MTAELRDRLQSTLGGAYTLERELGGGGMSRVFVAEETSLGRKVVVKVLSPELTAGLSIERFKREILVAAKLQQANIVPVLSAGETEGLPYYTMPMVEGLSLRGRLATTGALPIGETLGILKDVTKALAYAHEHGVVHRDIKPDNVLLSGGTAVVTDFGIAKAISESRAQARAEGRTSGSPLTEVGTSLGTPAYMAPEQAAGDPSTDHRADLYALGIMAYEMLAGRTPFHGLAPHKLLAAQMAELPRAVAEVRPEAPEPLAQLVSALLAKDPERRPRSAADVVRVLESVTSSPSGAGATAPVLLAPRVALWKALALYAAACIAVPIVARAAVIAIGLPEWVFPASIVVMALGLPAILLTHLVQRLARDALTSTPTLTPGGTPVRNTVATMAVKVSPHVTWKRALWGGVAAVAALVLATGGYMTLRALGIGPAGSLMAAGVLGEREKLILAEFRSPPNDSTLGPIVTDALRADLAQSRNLDLVQPTAIREALRRMQRAPDGRLDFTLAREIATREGVKAVMDGEVLGLGGSYLLTARLVTAQTGEELATFREEAPEARDLIAAIGRLSRNVRARIGESLRSVQATPPLERVSTGSLEALRKYVQGSRALSMGEQEKGVRLLEEAVAIDSAFGMAWRRLAINQSNRGGQIERAIFLVQKAYDNRARMSDAERYLTEAAYWFTGPRQDMQKTIDAYAALLELQPANGTALNNLANRLDERRQFASAETLRARALATEPGNPLYGTSYVLSLQRAGKHVDAERVMNSLMARSPASPLLAARRSLHEWMRGEYDRAGAILDSLRWNPAADAVTRESAILDRSALSRLRGRTGESLRLQAEATAIRRARGVKAAALESAIDSALVLAWFHEQPARAAALLDGALRRHPLDSIPEPDRPYETLARAYALAGRPDRARTVLAALEARSARLGRFYDSIFERTARGDIAVAERRYADAVRNYREADAGPCTACALPVLARAYDLGGNTDSAIAVFERFVADARSVPTAAQPLYLAGARKRLGELYEAKGERARALSHYLKFVQLWKDADAELQPKVAEVRQRILRLRDTERR